MTRVRLREAYPDAREFYAGRYPDGYQHTQWPDHIERVAATADFVRKHLDSGLVMAGSVADLSCGDAAIVEKILSSDLKRYWTVVLGDLKLSDSITRGSQVRSGVEMPNTVFHLASRIELHEGPVEQTLEAMQDVDLFVCSETLEHLDDPDTFLAAVRTKSRNILITTPDGETDPAMNPEHYWGWDCLDISRMLHTAGWKVYDHTVFTPQFAGSPYRFQMWMAHR